ncbi:hypothetical protein BGZ96_003084 [Linnemannia gamsii]|uniref:Uncharacterized protein n=1 Tax=Linnemannia gamsii TaxID=64522 RepID=A0ABQ7K7B3_9FUNG|nr:hypothetical protein BGZ96_003084 [Linnemannia gamsii]
MELHIRNIRKGGPWVCKRMVDLSFSFSLWLEQVDVGWRNFACSPLADKAQDAVETTRFIQDQHLVFDRLASLTALESSDVQRSHFAAGEEGCGDNGLQWPKLNYLQGRLNADRHAGVILQEYVEERNIYTSFFDD